MGGEMGWLRTFLLGVAAGQASSNPRLSTTPAVRAAYQVSWRQGSYPLSAVGESNYQDALSRICGGHNRDGHELECLAVVIPEPTNPYDPNAHKVMINGLLVGYLPRDEAKRFKTQARNAGIAGQAVEVAALISGGWRTNQYDEGFFGVRLGIPLRDDIVFENIS